jgi:hypothetical protein
MKISSPFNAINSYSEIGKNITTNLNDINCDFEYHDSSSRYLLEKITRHSVDGGHESYAAIGKFIMNGSVINLKKYESDSVVPMFSTYVNRLPKSIMDTLRNKKIITFNNATLKTLENSGFNGEIEKSTILNDMNIFRKIDKLMGFPEEKFMFLTVCNTDHPSWMDTVKAYYQAFDKKDNVAMVIKVYGNSFNRYSQADIIKKLKDVKQGFKKELPELIFIGSEMDHNTYLRLFKTCDCYVKLYCQTGLTHLNAMSAGMITIGPETGPCREFMNNDNSFLVSKKKEERLSIDNDLNGMPCDVYDFNQLVYLMKHVYDNADAVKEKSAKKRRINVSKLDRSFVVPKLISMYKRL